MTDQTPQPTTEPVAWLLTHPTEPKDVELANASREPITGDDRKAGWKAEALYRNAEAGSDHRAFVNRVGRLPHPADDDYAYPDDIDAEREALNGLIADAREIMASTTPQPLAIGLDREAVADAVHRGRFPADREPTPFETEDRSGREYCFRIADKILALAAPAEGYVLVPKEPTEAMISAGRDAAQSAGAHYVPWADAAKSTWSSMIAACLPAAPAGEML